LIDSDGDGVADSEDLCPGFDDTVDVDQDGIPDVCDVCPADPLDACNEQGSTAEEIPAQEGGTVETPDGALAIDVDPDDLAENATISVTQTIPQNPEVDLLIGSSPGLGVATAVYDLEPDGQQFNNSVTITVTADVTDLNPNLRDRLRLFQRADDTTQFEEVANAVCYDAVQNQEGRFIKTCTAELDHFSVYAMVAPLDSDDDGIPDLFGDEQDHCLALPMQESISIYYTGGLVLPVGERSCT
jgi:hypothetical protein